MKGIDFKEFDADTESEIFPLLSNGSLHILDRDIAEKYGDLIVKNFSWRAGRVQFDSFSLVVSKSNVKYCIEQDYIDIIREKLAHIALEYEMWDEIFVLIGDNLIENVYFFEFRDFLDFFGYFSQFRSIRM